MVGEHLLGKVAIVTGSGRGIGKAIALRLARAGADVVVHDENEEAPRKFGESKSLEEVAEQIHSLGRRSLPLFGDLTIKENCQRITDAVLSEFGRIDILVNNAGGDIGAFGEKPDPNDLFIPEPDLYAVIKRNLMTTIHMCRAVAPAMMKQRYGKIVNIASVVAFLARDREIAYSTAKSAVVQFTRCLAAMLRPYGINVNAVAPGDTLTGRYLATLRQRGLSEDDIKPKGRLERFGEPDDIAKVVEFFASDWSDFVTGQVLVVDGGMFLGRT
ncbi:MAG: SDR family NAD(P)-dependent oxidoreductase [Candidatus Fervidibacter sp.]|uniref:SDR family NAD(P)-dependent oxidoreductase n=1 Tax=Candidatus Fervidibacter sp. TaxID=3100871 RepID=UPI00404AC5EE